MKRDYFYIFGFVILVIIWQYDRCNQRKQHKAELNQSTRSATSLLQDTLKQVEKKKDAYWSVIISEIAPKKLDKDIVAELNYNQQLLLIELAKYKNLVASYQTKYTGTKVDTITQVIRIPVLKPFYLSWIDTTGGFTYNDTVYVDSNMTKRVFLPQLRFTHDVRITKNRKGEVTGEIRVKGLEEFSLVAENVYSFHSKPSPADIRKKKWLKTLKITGVVGSNILSFYLGTQID